MKRTLRDTGFTALRVEGGLIPPEYLQTISALEATHQTNADYGVTKSLNIKGEMGRYWRIAADLWSDYKERRVRGSLDVAKTAIDTWLKPLLQEVLGYHDLAPASPITLGERTFPVSHTAWGGAVPFVLTGHTFELDRGHPWFGDEGRRRPPHGLIQEYLNAADFCLWGMVANGNRIRLVRDNPSLTRPAYLEVDLERLFEEQLFSDFAAFWLTFHVSRLTPREGKPANCILEAWRSESIEIGERAREKLRQGVTDALRELGNGFLEHPDNGTLRTALSEGTLTEAAYFQELLRLVYRLLFLFTVEDRHLLFGPETSPESQRLYQDGYSIARLRDRALKRRHYDTYADLWEGLRIVFNGLATGAPSLGLPALGGLFSRDQCPHLDAYLISNKWLLQAIQALAFFRSGKTLARVNYRDMGTEELGSIYESLLDLHPLVEVTPWRFGFVGEEENTKTRGSDRKLTGSYYTPPELVNELIKSALLPVIERAVKENPANPSETLLKLKVVDPACGSGHFLLAAARQLAAEIARLEAGADTPVESLRQHALRAVVRHCIYGVDRNPLAVELCKTALWIEAVEPGKPLSFLDAHLRCGDSLIGILDPQVMENGIPDTAYAPLTGDDKAVCSSVKRKNLPGNDKVIQTELFNLLIEQRDSKVSINLETMPEETLSQVEAKREAWKQTEANTNHQKELLKANLFVGAFFAQKAQESVNQIPITEDLNRLKQDLKPRSGVSELVTALATKHLFFHWRLVFPEVFANGGFDVALGNPPWERVKLQEQEFFASRSPAIAKAKNKAERDRLIRKLVDSEATPVERALARSFEQAKHEAEAASQFIRTSKRYPLTGVGDVNTYAVFAETFKNIIAHNKGRAGFIVQSGIATDSSTKNYFDEITAKGLLVSFYDMVNLEGIFPGIHRTHPHFCLMTLGSSEIRQGARFSFYNTNTAHLSDKRRIFRLSPEDIRLLNPNTKTCPVFRSNADAELTKKIYQRVPILIDEAKGPKGNPWGINFMAMFHMSNDSHLFRTYEQLRELGAQRYGVNWVTLDNKVWVPLYEAKMIHHYDHRWATYEENGTDSRDMTGIEKSQSNIEPLPRYWVPQREVEDRLRDKGWKYNWLMGWRDITNATNERTVIATVVPRVGVGHTLPIFFLDNLLGLNLYAAILANWSTLVLDFIARQKIGGTHLTYSYLNQFPILPPSAYSLVDIAFISVRVLELTYTTESLRPFAEDLGYQGPPFPWNPDRRATLRAELDAYYARLYGLTRDELRYILDPTDVYGDDYPSETFRVLKNNEMKQFGEYRTRRLVLEAWDRQELKFSRIALAV